MHTDAILQALAARGVTVTRGAAPGVDVSPRLVRCPDLDGAPAVCAGAEAQELARICAVVDGLHLYPDASALQVVLGDDGSDEAVAAASLLAATWRGPPQISVLASFEVAPAPAPLGPADAQACLTRLEHRSAPAPALAEALDAALGDPGWGWRFDGASWWGHADGLPLVRLGEQAAIAVPEAAPSTARRRALELLGSHTGPFVAGDIERVAGALQVVLADRAAGRLRFEARREGLIAKLARGATTIAPGGASLALAYQDVPTRWTAGGALRTADLLMCDGQAPWVVQVVIGDGGIDERFRHAVAVAALHRAFIRTMSGLDLDLASCRAAVVFPKLTSARGRQRLAALSRIAGGLDVALLQVR